MHDDVEEILRRELREVASDLRVPARPPLQREPVRGQRLWRPLLVAAVILVITGAVAVVSSYPDGGEPKPATSPTAPTERPSARPLTADAPTVPYVFDSRLYAGGEQLLGFWWTLSQAGGTWVAQRDDATWWWGTGAEEHAISGTVILQPRLSPDGTLLAVATTQDGGRALIIDTRSGETVNTLRIDATGPDDPSALGVVAVTDDAKVFLSSDSRHLMWLADGGDEPVELGTTAPDQWVRGSTTAGLIVFDGTKDGERDATYLAEPTDSGTLRRLQTLPGEEVRVNPSGTWLGYGGSWGGESQTISEITAQTVGGTGRLALRPPDNRQLLLMTWEDDDLLLAELHTDGSPTGLARCSIREAECLEIDVP